MSNVDPRTARSTVQTIIRQMERVSQLSKANPGLVRMASQNGDSIAFWNDGSPREFNISAAQRMLESISKKFPEALKTRSGSLIRIELPLSH